MPTIDGPDGRLHYLDEGAGDPPLLLVHAFPLSASMWEPQIAAIAPRHRVIAPDMRGFGQSVVPSERAAYSVATWADDLAALITALDLGPVVLGGLSMGGYVAFAFVRRHPEALAGVLLADTRPGADTAEVRARREDQQSRLAATGEPGALADELLGPLVGSASTRGDETLAAARQLLAANRAEGVIGALEALKNRPDSTGDLGAIAVPTVVVVGEQDRPSPPAEAERMAKAIRGARLVVIPDAGHLSNMENPAAFNAAVEGLLDRVRA